MWIVWMQTCNWFMYVDPKAYKNLVIFRTCRIPNFQTRMKATGFLEAFLYRLCFSGFSFLFLCTIPLFLHSSPPALVPFHFHVTCILAHSPPSLLQFLVSEHLHKYKLEIGSAHEIKHGVLVIFSLGSWLIVFKILISRPINLNTQFIFLYWG